MSILPISKRLKSRLEDLVCAVVGVCKHRLRRCSEDNAAYVWRLFWQIVFSWAFVALVSFTAISVAFPPDT